MKLNLLAAPSPVILDYRSAAGLGDLLHNISGVAVDGQSLRTVSDEARTVEHLEAAGADYVLAEQLNLDRLFPELPTGKEADLEAVGIASGRLWVCGSHCRVRRKLPEAMLVRWQTLEHPFGTIRLMLGQRPFVSGA